MSAFDKVIGYDSIKKELLQVIDMIHRKEVYKEMGARMPQGILLYGDPGLGKTMMAKCFIKEAGLKAYTVRRTKSNDFVEEISKTFKEAKENAPSIIFLDDLDKFANKDKRHIDAKEYVAVQAGIDETIDSDVFVFATVNDMDKLPKSLRRAGRFDIKIGIQPPNGNDAKRIVTYFLSDKKVSDNVCMDDFCKMINYNSCAELEMIINQAAIYAASEGKESIEMDHLCASVLRTVYDSPDELKIKTKHKLEITAMHEAGHVVVAEVLNPGSVGFASLKSNGWDSESGFVHMCKGPFDSELDALVSLAGRAAGEIYYYGEGFDGCESDLHRAVSRIYDAVYHKGTHGMGLLKTEPVWAPSPSQKKIANVEMVVQTQMERALFRVKEILMKNRCFLEKVRDELLEKETLLHSDIQKIKREVNEELPPEAA